MDVCQKKQEHLQPSAPDDIGDAWVWKALALPSRLRVATHLSHDRSEKEASAFLAEFKAKTDGRPPLFTSDKLPAYVQALIANYSTPEPPPVKRGPGRPRKEPRRVPNPELYYAQVDKHRENGRVVEVRGASSLAPVKSSQRFLVTIKSTPRTLNVTILPRVRAMDD